PPSTWLRPQPLRPATRSRISAGRSRCDPFQDAYNAGSSEQDHPPLANGSALDIAAEPSAAVSISVARFAPRHELPKCQTFPRYLQAVDGPDHRCRERRILE